MRTKLLLSVTTISMLAAAAWASPNARYVVFSIDQHGTITALHQELVTSRTATRSEAEIAKLIASTPVDLERIELTATDAAGGVLFRDIVELPGHTSLELGLHADEHGHESVDTTSAGERLFVARLPYVSGGKVRFRRAAGGEPRQASAKAQIAAEFDLDAVTGDPRLRSESAPARVLSTGAGGEKAAAVDSANRLDLLIMGDGYTAAESAKFQQDAAKMIDKFFSISPYRAYRNFVKPVALFTPSGQSGSDHPPFSAACASGACCSDPAMKSDPKAGKFVDTAFDTSYCNHNLHRLISVDSAKVLAAAAAYPEWDQILVLVNDATYGGSGGEVSVASINDLAVRLAQHEFGHSFTRLTDEYTERDQVRPACNDTLGPACEPNATDQTGRDQIKWRAFIAQSTPLPTDVADPESEVVGLFKGARSEEDGYFRPQQACLMKDLAHGFCDICAQEFILKLYRGWAAGTGIDTIEPGSEMPAPGKVTATAGGSVDFRAALLSPAEGPPVSATWYVNGTAAGNGATFKFVPPAAGNYTVELKTRDTTPIVKAAMAGSALESSRTWTVNASGAAAALPCTGGGRDLCLLGNRFRVQVDWHNQHGGNRGQGTAVPLSAETGYFWFFNAGNAELMVKILDGRGVNGKFWVFYGTLSDVEYTITVTDTTNGATKTYRNPPGNMASVADTSAL